MVTPPVNPWARERADDARRARSSRDSILQDTPM
jgi:hypothetical protein